MHVDTQHQHDIDEAGSGGQLYGRCGCGGFGGSIARTLAHVDGLIDGWMDGQTDGWTDGMDGWDGWMG